MLELLPKRLQKRFTLPETTFPRDNPRARVALISGCAQSVLAPEIGRATVDVLALNGVEVIVPRQQTCCGALHWHAGAGEKTKFFARKNVGAFPEDIDAIVSNAAGCGSCLQEYSLVLKGDSTEKSARAFSSRVRDLTVFLDDLGIAPIPPAVKPLRVVYQDACHLLHGQGVSAAPRRILNNISGIELLEIEEPEVCCGSAGIYNIEQLEIANELGRKKASYILTAKPDLIVSTNIGCISQLRRHLNKFPESPRILHFAEVLQQAYNGELGK